MNKRDCELGMNRPISRRDFLNGVAVGVGAAIAAPHWVAALDSHEYAPEKDPNYYPPALTGMRGNHDGTFTFAHLLRDGESWDSIGSPESTGEAYDLIVVGGGISGLAAAYFYRQSSGNKARILILDNHDDFGGHAKRNEFRAGGRMILGFGGTYSIESPAPYSAVAKGLIEELGIDVPSYPRYVDKNLYRSHGMKPHIFFDKETFGTDKLVVNAMRAGGEEGAPDHESAEAALREFLTQAPLSTKARQDCQRLLTEEKDYFPNL